MFFMIYRLSVFNTVPRDDYAPFLLWLLGQPGGVFPESPYGFRVLSMLAAAPFYYVLPDIPLTNTPAGLSGPYLRATAALAAVAFLAWIASAMLAYAAARRAGLEPRDGILASGLAFALMGYVQITAIDPLAVALIAAGVWSVNRRWAFAVLLAISVPLNEKVPLVLAAWLVMRCVMSREDRATLGWQAAAAALALGAYVAMVKLLHLPGNAYQVDPGHYPATLRENVLAYMTARGLVLNVAPILLLSALALLGRPSGLFRRADALVIPGLAVVALLLTHLFQAGRIVMHAAPIFVVPAAAAVSTWLDRRLACRLEQRRGDPTYGSLGASSLSGQSGQGAEPSLSLNR
ncbi:MAG: hypothetical protein NVSMB18_15090 [Acetobacteraceae bacterium]